MQVGGLSQHRCRALLDRARDARPVGMGAEDQRLDAGVAVAQILDEVRTVAVRQLEVKDRHVDAVEQAASLGERPSLAGDDELVVLGEGQRDRLADGGVVVHQQDAHAVGRAAALRERHAQLDERPALGRALQA